jgi:hypothetical protein
MTAMAVLLCSAAAGYSLDFSKLSNLTPGRVAADNALWIETPAERRFDNSKEVVVADLKGPGVITMIHFAQPQQAVAKPKEYHLNRDLVLRIYWDGETEPSVECPMVDFFCDPDGLREQVNTALVNKRRGFNCYFPMPFRKSARVMLVYQGSEQPGHQLWAMMPCYSYVMWRSTDQVTDDEGYFHAWWNQQAVLMGKEDYPAMEAKGRGKFIGWNVTLRRPGLPGYPVDMNEKFYIDGEKAASVEFQGIEDSFGFSWGFPETENIFPLTGYWPFMKGAMAYRFFIDDSISFEKSLRVDIGFGVNEDSMFRREFSKPGTTLQLSSTCYWYQTEPHAAFAPLPAVGENREPAAEQPFWPMKAEPLPTADELKARGVKLYMLCGRPEKEVIFAESGFGAANKQGYGWAGWTPPVYHCRADNNEVQIELTVPKGTTGTLRLFITDPDNFEGGRKEELFVGDKSLGTFEKFQEGRWVEAKVSESMTSDGKLLTRAANRAQKGNAVISIIEWVGKN